MTDDVSDVKSFRTQYAHCIQVSYKDGSLFVFDANCLACFYCFVKEDEDSRDSDEISPDDDPKNNNDGSEILGTDIQKNVGKD